MLPHCVKPWGEEEGEEEHGSGRREEGEGTSTCREGRWGGMSILMGERREDGRMRKVVRVSCAERGQCRHL